MQYFTNMSLVNGYRVKCQNYKRMAEREGEMRRREEKLGSWSQEKASRKAAIKKFKKRLKGGIAKIFRSITFLILHISRSFIRESNNLAELRHSGLYLD